MCCSILKPSWSHVLNWRCDVLRHDVAPPCDDAVPSHTSSHIDTISWHNIIKLKSSAFPQPGPRKGERDYKIIFAPVNFSWSVGEYSRHHNHSWSPKTSWISELGVFKKYKGEFMGMVFMGCYVPCP